jgi:hypothetical protein
MNMGESSRGENDKHEHPEIEIHQNYAALGDLLAHPAALDINELDQNVYQVLESALEKDEEEIRAYTEDLIARNIIVQHPHQEERFGINRRLLNETVGITIVTDPASVLERDDQIAMLQETVRRSFIISYQREPADTDLDQEVLAQQTEAVGARLQQEITSYIPADEVDADTESFVRELIDVGQEAGLLSKQRTRQITAKLPGKYKKRRFF